MRHPVPGLDRAAVRLGLASPDDVLSWSSGEVTRCETVNYRTLRPEKGGLFCPRIFGPERDHECACGRYKGLRYKGRTCEHCGVDVVASRARRTRMGHIDLVFPVVHVWFVRHIPSRLALLLGMKRRELERLVYYSAHVVLDPGPTTLADGQLLDDAELRQARERFGDNFRVESGALAVEEM